MSIFDRDRENNKNKIQSEPNLFGGYNNYDEHGRKVGESDPGIFGGWTTRKK